MELAEIKSGIEAHAAEAAVYLTTAQKPIKADFPRKWIRALASHKGRWAYLQPERRRTVACVIQLCDINRFHLALWEIKLTAGSMWAWQSAMPVIAVIETLLYEVGRQEGWVAEGEGFKKCINTFNSKGVYKEAFKKELHELRDFRNEIHIFLKDRKVEMHDGRPKEYNRAVKALHELEVRLDEYFKTKHA